MIPTGVTAAGGDEEVLILLPRYQDMKMDFILPGTSLGIGDANLRMLMDITMAYTNINEPVTIEAPVTQ